jgi:hypothetical protein
MKDILSELSSRALDEAEMIACLRWRLSLDDGIVRANQQALVTDFLNAATVFIPSRNSGGTHTSERVVALSEVRNYYKQSLGVIAKSPLPPRTLPVSLSEQLPITRLAAAFSWTPLTASNWLQHLLAPASSIPSDFVLTTSLPFAEKVLSGLADVWKSLPTEERTAIKEALISKTCIPTRVLGNPQDEPKADAPKPATAMTLPTNSYFPNVDIFPDLPIVTIGAADKDPLRNLVRFFARTWICC